MREKLTPGEYQLLQLIVKYHNRKLNMLHYSYLMGTSRRWARMCLSGLRKKKYVKVYPEHMRIHKSQTCKYVLLDEHGKELN